MHFSLKNFFDRLEKELELAIKSMIKKKRVIEKVNGDYIVHFMPEA